jgi:EAL domain-containing protein (putative c-di-GMP-specific phosphodiesterase class I)
MVSSIVGDLGFRLQGFDDVAAMLNMALHQQPDVIFVEFDPHASSDASTVDALVASRVGCAVQLISGSSPTLVEEVRRNGAAGGLHMLPVLYKPFRHDAIKQVVKDLDLRRGVPSTQRLELKDILVANRLEPWYQPKIDLRKKCLVGAEIFVRVRHPEHGILSPDSFLDGATEADLLTLTSYMLAVALREWRDFADLCPEMKLAVNIPVSALVKLPIVAIVKHNRPKNPNWPGIILEIPEGDFIPVISLVQDIAEELRSFGVGLAVDDCGLGRASLARLKRPPFCELKIDRSFVSGCDTEMAAADICKTVIELAQDLGVTAVAEGIETAEELKTLVGMKCPVGQGYLFARPMPKEQLLAQVRRRAVRAGRLK